MTVLEKVEATGYWVQVCKTCLGTSRQVPALTSSTAQTGRTARSAAIRSSCAQGWARPPPGSSRPPWTPPPTTLPSAPVLAPSPYRCLAACNTLVLSMIQRCPDSLQIILQGLQLLPCQAALCCCLRSACKEMCFSATTLPK